MGRIPSQGGNTRLSDCTQAEFKMSAVGRKRTLWTPIWPDLPECLLSIQSRRSQAMHLISVA